MNVTEMTYPDRIDEADWQHVVAALLDSEHAQVISRHCDEIFVGAGAGTHVFRVVGTADTGGSRPVDWALVVKFFTLDQRSFQSLSTDEHAWDYWKREWHAYRSPWQQQLDGPVTAPQCYGSGELEVVGEGELVAWIAMEELEMPHVHWAEQHFTEAARHLGMFNGRYLAEPAPEESWLSRDWLRGWTEQAAEFIPVLPAAVDHPVAGRIFTADVVDDLVQMWEERDKFYAVLQELPRTLSHNDAYPRNLCLRERDEPESVAIDWAFCGTAPVGQELSAMVGATQVFLESPPERWGELERLCLDGYQQGLRAMGWSGADEASAGYLLSTVLRFGVGGLPAVLSLTLTSEYRDAVTQVFGCSYDDFLANTAAVVRFQQRRIHQANALLGL
jgi:hypothetical protein